MAVITLTAQADPARARVILTGRGGAAGEALYIFRRDGAGVGAVRDTSLGTLTWPGELLSNADVNTTTEGWGATPPAGMTVALTVDPQGGILDGAYLRATFSGTATAVGGTVYHGTGAASRAALTPGAEHLGVAHVRASKAMTLALELQRFSAAGATLSTVPGPSITVTPEVWTELPEVVHTEDGSAATAALRIRISGGPLLVAGDELDVDAASVRLSSVLVTDYEARQGELTTYLLADANGNTDASTTLTVPAWGTWLKSPGQPFLNTRCYLEQEAPVTRPARRTVVPVEGGGTVVLSARRDSRRGALRLVTLTDTGAMGLDMLLESGLTLMLDTSPRWDSPWRYVSVGDVTVERAYGDGITSLDRDARVHVLQDVVEVDAPGGLTTVAGARTYADLPEDFASYVALPAVHPRYQELAVGQ